MAETCGRTSAGSYVVASSYRAAVDMDIRIC